MAYYVIDFPQIQCCYRREIIQNEQDLPLHCPPDCRLPRWQLGRAWSCTVHVPLGIPTRQRLRISAHRPDARLRAALVSERAAERFRERAVGRAYRLQSPIDLCPMVDPQ